MNARLIISKNRSRTILLETKVSKKFAKEDDFLNHHLTMELAAMSSASALDKANTD